VCAAMVTGEMPVQISWRNRFGGALGYIICYPTSGGAEGVEMASGGYK